MIRPTRSGRMRCLQTEYDGICTGGENPNRGQSHPYQSGQPLMEPAHLEAVEIRSARTHHRSVSVAASTDGRHHDAHLPTGLASMQQGSTARTSPAKARRRDNGYGRLTP